jgi:hypothetical protein
VSCVSQSNCTLQLELNYFYILSGKKVEKDIIEMRSPYIGTCNLVMNVRVPSIFTTYCNDSVVLNGKNV